MSENKYVNGIYFYKPHSNAPDFVVADGSIDPDKLTQWLKTAPRNAKGYINFQVLTGRDESRLNAKLKDPKYDKG